MLLLDNDDTLSTGSRAICFAKRTLEIFDRLGLRRAHGRQGRVVERRQGVLQATSWSTSFDLLPEAGHERPAFINLQQYYVEGYLVERARELPTLELRWKNKVVGVAQDGRRRRRSRVDTPDGRYALRADYVVACDGARSACARCSARRARAACSATAS